MSAEFWLLVVLYLLTPVGIFVGRNWLKASIERGVQHGFDKKLEALKSELHNNEEEFKSELRQKEAQINALRDGMLDGRAQRQVLIDKRRLEAVDGLWAGFMALAPLTMVSASMAVINFDVAAQEAPVSPNARKFFQVITGNQEDTFKKLSQTTPKKEQPFVSPLAWAYYSAYQAIVLGAYMRAKVLEFGVDNPQKILNEEPVKNLIKAALPHYNEYIDEYGPSGYHYLLEELEKSLLTELQKMIRGEEQAAADVEQAARIMDMLDKVKVRPTPAAEEPVAAPATAQ